MFILGLTGSIGMGKTTTADIFRRLRIPVHDADAVAHELMKPHGPAVDLIAERFPGMVANGTVDRKRLGDMVFKNRNDIKALENIIHPFIQLEEYRFLKKAALRKTPLVVLDIPLLFETGGESRCHAVAVATAPGFVQKQRVMARPGMTRDRFMAILSMQISDVKKRERADFLIHTGLGRRRAFTDTLLILDEVCGSRGWRWHRSRNPLPYRP